MVNENTSNGRRPPERIVRPQSCVGCKYLYKKDTGYSNYTVTNTDVRCAKDRNPNLPDEEPYNWNQENDGDNWPKTNASRCGLYAEGPLVHLDVGGEDAPDDYTDDGEAVEAICKHSGRSRNGTAA